MTVESISALILTVKSIFSLDAPFASVSRRLMLRDSSGLLEVFRYPVASNTPSTASVVALLLKTMTS